MVLSAGHCRNFPRTVNSRQRCQALCFTIEGLNSFGTVLYTTYLYFYLHDRFGFTNKANLATAAIIGFFYTLASLQTGRFAQKHGQFKALKIGFGGMITLLMIGSLLHSAAGIIISAIGVSVFMCFTWPVLEALVSECEIPHRIPHAIGIYNITWAVTNAAAFFIGGTLIKLLGYQSIYYIPAGLMLLQLVLTVKAEKLRRELPVLTEPVLPGTALEADRPSAKKAKSFLHMAWLANPFAYLAINTLIAVIPGVAEKFQLSPMLAGFACSLWCFARLAVFMVLWRWTAWHYRFRWLVWAFVLLILSFGAILTVPNMAAMLAAQVFFGAAIGLIYYSSLFYSMDASESKSEHGGIHEAAIGVGNCVGPAVGAASLQFASQHANSGVVAVTGLLLIGLGGLLRIWKQR